MNVVTTFTAVVSKPAIRGSIPWPEASSIQQNFSLPSSIIYYMTKNLSSSTVYNKLIQAAKYFFEKNPILVAADFFGDPTKICSNEECDGDGPCCIKVNINKITSKFWFTHGLYLYCIESQDFVSLLRPKIYRCDINKIRIIDKHVLYYDFKFLASSAADVDLGNVEMFDNDGKMVPLEDIVEAVPKIKKFKYEFCKKSPVITASTMKNILKLMNPEQIEFFRLNKIPADALDVDDLSSFVTTFKDTKVQLMFGDNNSEAYKQQLDALVDTVIASEVRNRMICYKGQDRENRKILKERHDGDVYVPFYI